LRNRLKYALTGREVTAIVKQRIIKVDGKVRTDETFPAGFMGTWTSRIIIELRLTNRCHHH
jgi:small subunit ribosomal protein S4e